MSPYIIKVTEYCSKYEIDKDFLFQLEKESLIKIHIIDDDQWIDDSQFRKIEQYMRWYYDLSINVEGIDVIRNLLDKIDDMQEEINRLKQQLKLID